MNIANTVCAGAVGALLLASAGSALAQTAPSTLPIPPVARQQAEKDLDHAMADVKRPLRAEMDVENGETVLANGAEAQGANVQSDDAPFAQMYNARQTLLQRDGVRREETALRTAADAARQ